ncbi:Inner membrane transport permease YbhR [Botrimarina colliarenosi]|uniref:Transport permease protein n=1 Tax=Botrimarina colliarenosi TaxID=2528001 RepID=A0A5C6AJZ9_9BACT|nr:ABC transporter permease [Botrimarina colliarenosi]TWT99740.1 Inner membrane transport permease YbhR [Botrimarina colliarenosi]
MDSTPTYSSPLGVIAALAWRELVRFFRQRNRVIGGLVQPVLFWLLFSEGLKANALGYEHFFPGTLVMILLFTAIFATISVIEDRNEGFLQGVLVAPTQRLAIALGKVLGGAAIALAQATLFLLLGWATGSVAIAGPIDALLVFAAMTLIAIALTGLGFTIAWRMDSTQGFHAIMSVFLLPMWLLSGAFFRHGAEGWLGGVVTINPLTYGVAALRWRLGAGETAGLPAEPLCWAVTIGFAVAMVASSWWVAQRR